LEQYGRKGFGRCFPWAGNFFAELGAGFGYRTGTDTEGEFKVGIGFITAFGMGFAF
jgi:hypothetical protein